ncbi:extracellular solute-binding protein [Agromyces sp. ISL-38]|uniref:ABC transporter substrate-binding protein n=1 Tax=Agromyces sp. ISL-38 TaxID=2819107 RepID=UPI001BE6D7C0|nr:extracellular solute-binding protein [Agromyces sp. ISL-38]MBT2500155.1 extracellular solute-binding protein [Agromyces sp. ISL-38]
MRYRAVVTLAIGAAVVASIAGCSNDTGGGGGETLTWATVTSDKTAAKEAAAAFEAETGISVEVTASGVDEYQTTTRTQLSSGTAPDVFFVWAGDGNPMAMQVVSDAGLVADLSDMDFTSRIPEGFKSVSQNGGKTYTAPISSAGIGSAFNLTAMEENGWSIPTTWSDTLAFCGEAKAAGKTAFALAGATPWNTQLISYALAPTLVYGPDPDFAAQMSAGDVTFADSAWVDVFDKYLAMQDAGCFQDDALGTVYEDALDMVAKGEAMASVQVNASLAAIRQGAAEDTEFTLAPLPATDDESQTRMAAAMGAAYGINAKAKNPEGAKKLIEFLTSDEGQSVYNTPIAAIPALGSSTFEPDPALDSLLEYLESGKTDPFMDQLWPNAKVQQVHFEVVQQLLAGDVDAKGALSQMDAAYAEG